MGTRKRGLNATKEPGEEGGRCAHIGLKEKKNGKESSHRERNEISMPDSQKASLESGRLQEGRRGQVPSSYRKHQKGQMEIQKLVSAGGVRRKIYMYLRFRQSTVTCEDSGRITMGK